jgi:hypothetical protein
MASIDSVRTCTRKFSSGECRIINEAHSKFILRQRMHLPMLPSDSLAGKVSEKKIQPPTCSWTTTPLSLSRLMTIPTSFTFVCMTCWHVCVLCLCWFGEDVSVSESICVCVWVGVCVCIYMLIYTHVYIHTNISYDIYIIVTQLVCIMGTVTSMPVSESNVFLALLLWEHACQFNHDTADIAAILSLSLIYSQSSEDCLFCIKAKVWSGEGYDNLRGADRSSAGTCITSVNNASVY